MTARKHDIRHIDVAALAAEAGVLEGRWPLAEMARLADATPGVDVTWTARGQLREVSGGEPEIWLHLAVSTRVRRDCQRCLQPVELALEVARPLRFVAGEGVAEALDAECEDDVLALPRRLDLRELVEDELLLALPLVPVHDRCSKPLPMRAGVWPDEPGPETKVSPFAALARLKGGRQH